MSLSRSPMCTHRSGACKRAVACRRFSNHRTLSFCSMGTRVGLTLPLRALVPLNFLRLQNFTAAKRERQALRRYCQAGMHQQATTGVMPQAPLVVSAGHTLVEHPDGTDVLAFETKLGGVVQNQHRF